MTMPTPPLLSPFKTAAAACLLAGGFLASAQASENILPPLDTPASRPGDEVSLPWRSSDGNDDGLISIKLGSPTPGESGWAAFEDKSPSQTANLRLSKLPPVSRGEFSFEIQIAPDSSSPVAVLLGIDDVSSTLTRLIIWKFLPNGKIRVGVQDNEQELATLYTPGTPEKFRCTFDVQAEGGAVIQFFTADKPEAIGEVRWPEQLPAIDGVRVTSSQKGAPLHWFVRGLSLIPQS